MTLRAYHVRKTQGGYQQWCPLCSSTASTAGARTHECAGYCGPGCHLKRLLSWFGIRDDGKCNCAEYAALMDTWGPDGCAEREDEIVGKLAQAATNRHLPFVPFVARRLVRQAISNARRERAAPAPPPPAGP